MPSGSRSSCCKPMPGWVSAPIRNAVATAAEQRASSGIRLQSRPAKTPKMIARATTSSYDRPACSIPQPCIWVRTLEGEGWRVELPDGLIARKHQAFGYDSGAIARGWIGNAPVTVVVQVRALETGFNPWVRELHRSWLEHEERRIDMRGAADAIRTDG